MTKKQLYIIVAVLAAIVLGLLFIPTDSQTPDIRPELSPATATEESEFKDADTAQTTTEDNATQTESVPESVTINGVFLSLEDSEMRDRKMHQYMLVRDDTEVLRIDLRPLIGYKNTDVEATLGVSRGERVVITGVVVDGNFKIQKIHSSE